MNPGLYLVATPIGNLGDITDRAKEALRECDRIFAEDTRRTGILLHHLGFKKPLTSCHEHNEARRAAELMGLLEKGEAVVLVSDAGMPSLSDPGYRLVQAVLENNFALEVIPGASAITMALALSGLPTDRFVFDGFFPRKPGKTEKLLETWKTEVRTIVFFESPHRIGKTLGKLAEAFPDRRLALCRELTKKFEEVIRGTCSEVFAQTKDRNWKGEITVVLEGKKK